MFIHTGVISNFALIISEGEAYLHDGVATIVSIG
jgi:hypothetical protein